MRIAFFDGILETHVASSLQRSFEKLGHQVLNTGKFGHGFQFRIERSFGTEVAAVLDRIRDFKPDWIIVFRPASAPHSVLEALRSTGSNLAVWLSDDPVLFNLSYGPIIDQYDVVMHCGNATVLDFYEGIFGRPTGVNMPFWTDHEAFPRVYGDNPPESTAMFLGNVHDQVRRRRYFDLARMDNSVRIHGSIGKDYFNIYGGYLDTDQEVVDAGSRASVAINIPQFFRDHRGLTTWFPGLDELGFFEFPSRVIQYAAMGLPIVSIVPDGKPSRSLPEMKIVNSISEADMYISELLSGGQLEELSMATSNRFDKSFSADARALAMLDLFANDDWKKLDSTERELWFTQFDGTSVTREQDEMPVNTKYVSALVSPKNCWNEVAFLLSDAAVDTRLREFATSIDGQSCRLCSESESLKYLEKGSVGKKVLNISRFLRDNKFDLEQANLLFLGHGMSVTQSGAEYAKAHNVLLMSGDEKIAGLGGGLIAPGFANEWTTCQENGMPIFEIPLVRNQTIRSSEAASHIVLISDENEVEASIRLKKEFIAAAIDERIVEVDAADVARMSTEELAGVVADAVVVLPVIKIGQKTSYPPIVDVVITMSDLVIVQRNFAFAENDPYAEYLTKVADVSEALLKVRRRINSLNSFSRETLSLSGSIYGKDVLDQLFSMWDGDEPPEEASQSIGVSEEAVNLSLNKAVQIGEFLNVDVNGNAALSISLPSSAQRPVKLTLTVSEKVSRSVVLGPEKNLLAEFSGIPAASPNISLVGEFAENQSIAFSNVTDSLSLVMKPHSGTRIVGLQETNLPRISITPVATTIG